jgi:predicted kinase
VTGMCAVSAEALVLVSGAPASGKSTLARPLARMLGFALLSKDIIKETLHESLNMTADLDQSRRLGAAAMELLWALALSCPHAVLEANFRPHNRYELDRLAALARPTVEVHCTCPPSVAYQRFRARAEAPEHHHAHALKELPLDLLGEYDRPMTIGHVIRVDTTSTVDVAALANQIRSCWTHHSRPHDGHGSIPSHLPPDTVEGVHPLE